MRNLYKILLVVTTVIAFIFYDVIYTTGVKDVRSYNMIVELSLSLLSAILFVSIETLKGKSFYKFLSVGFFLIFVSMLVDGLDQLHIHGIVYTALFEKTTLWVGFIFLFIGVKAWIQDHGIMNSKLEKQAFTDELTGLYNRRGMMKEFEAMEIKSKQSKLPLSFIIADLDDFKMFNDTLGHLEGDAYLANLGASLLTMACENIIIGRWGGEEFAVCLLNHDVKQALGYSEKIRQVVAEIPVPISMKKQNMTVSLGVSEKTSQEKILDAIKRADRSLYAAKSQGKNQSIAS